MYCINCGVKLADSEKVCPLCGVEVFHPDIPVREGEHLYPKNHYPVYQVNSRISQIIWTTLALMAMLITLQCDLQITGRVSWSGYVIGAVLVAYTMLILPFWFQKPNPVIFVPCTFAAVGVYLLYINFAVGGSWFLSFAFPVTGFLALTVTAVVVLLKYVRRGYLYIFGGALIALGLFMPLMEFLIFLTFDLRKFFCWSQYPMTALVLLGGMLIFLAICRPARETMERKFFI